jgi:hypothetical protein
MDKILSEKLTRQDKSDLAEAVFRSREVLTDCFTKHTPEFRQDKEFWEALGLARTGLEAQFKVEEIY